MPSSAQSTVHTPVGGATSTDTERVTPVPALEPGRAVTPASGNLRMHFLRAGVRLVGLVAVDLTAVGAGAGLLRVARTGLLGDRLASIAATLFPTEALGVHIAAAIVLALFFTECYRAGDRWRDPVGIITAVGLGVFLAHYGDLWRSEPTVVAARGLTVWICLSLLIVVARKLTSAAVGAGNHRALQHRVLLIRARDSEPHPVHLGVGYEIHAVVEADEAPSGTRALEDWLAQGVDTILVSDEVPARDFTRIADFALTHGCRLLGVPRSSELVGVEPRTVWHGGQPYLELTAPGLRATHLLVKRIFDIVVSGALLVLLSPLMALVALAIWIESPGPVFFRQKRAGHRGRYFLLQKFRSMRPDAESLLRRDAALWRRYVENNFKLPEDEDPRITSLGRFLRKTSLDELPQLFNVFRGEMSLVGPRPVVEPELQMYQGHEWTLLSVKPGMTGLWQISGRSQVGFPQRAEIDLEYVRKWSLLGDLWILLMTVPTVLARRGAH